MIDDRLRHAGERAAALLDRFDQPLGRVDFSLDVFARFGVRCPRRAAACDSSGLMYRVGQCGRLRAELDTCLRRCARQTHRASRSAHVRVGEVGARLWLELAQLVPNFLDLLDRHAGLLRDLRQPIVLQVFQMIVDQRSQLVVIRHARDELQQQALFQIAGTDAGRIEPLHDAQRLFGNAICFAIRLQVAVHFGGDGGSSSSSGVFR